MGGTRCGARARGRHCFVVGLAIGLASPARAEDPRPPEAVASTDPKAPPPSLLLPAPHATPGLADEGAAVTLLVRSMMAVPGVAVVAPAASPDPLASGLAALGEGPGFIAITEVARRGSGLRASVRLVEAGNKEVGATTVSGGDGDVRALALGISRFLGAKIGVEPLETPNASAGSLRRFARAATAPPAEAVKILAAADGRVAGPVGATRELAAGIWKDEANSLETRMEAALLGQANQTAIELADRILATDPKNAKAAAVKARALVSTMSLDEAASALAPVADSTDPAVLLARAELAHYQRDPATRDAALAPLLAAGGEAALPALSLIAGLPPGALGPELEKAALAAAPADDARLRSALALRAAQGKVGGAEVLAMIALRELDEREVAGLTGVLKDAGDGAAATRLRVELALRTADRKAAFLELDKLAKLEPDSAHVHLYRGRLLLETGDFNKAVAELTLAKALPDAGVELVRALQYAGRTAEASKLIEELGLGGTVEGDTATAMALLKAGKSRAALEMLRKVELLSPANPEIQRALAQALGDLGQAQAAEAAAALAKQLEGGAALVALGDGKDAEQAKVIDVGVKAIANQLAELLAMFPTLPTVDRLILVPLEGSHEPLWKPRQVDPALLKAALAVALNENGLRIRIAEVAAQEMAEPLEGPELGRLASAAGVDAILLYKVRTAGSGAAVRLVMFDARPKVALEATRTIGAPGAMVHWNTIFFIWTGALLAGLIGYVAYVLIRGWGSISVRVKVDPEWTEEALSLRVSRVALRPVIKDVEKFRQQAKAHGVRQRGKRADLIGPQTRFRRLPPGHYFVHLIGVYDRANETCLVDDRWTQEVDVVRGQAHHVTFDLIPTHAELRLKVYDHGVAAPDVMVWLSTSPNERARTNGDGEVILKMPLGELNLHVEGNDMSIVKPMTVPSPTIERMAIQLDRERRLRDIAGDTSLLGKSGPNAVMQHSGPDELTLAPAPSASAMPRAAGTQGQVGPLASPTDATMAAGTGGAPAASSGSIAVGQSVLGRYQLTRELGRGAMGVVFRAHDDNLDREVALKIISDDLRHHPEALKLFLQEAKALAKLNHPNIVAVYDQSEHAGQAYMVMEFVEGATLESVLAERGGKLTVGETLALMDQVFAGLAYAHDRKVIHRDIKPANIFVSTDQLVKIGDFGLARVMRELSLKRTEIRGTPLYMAPEQIVGTNVSHRSDLYAAGCTAFELLTGQPPFVDGDILYHHIHSAVPAPSAVDPGIPPEIDQFIMKCIAKDAAQRFDSAHTVREQIRGLQRQFGG